MKNSDSSLFATASLNSPAADSQHTDSEEEIASLRRQLREQQAELERTRQKLEQVNEELHRFVQKPLLDRLAVEDYQGKYESLHPGHYPEEEELTVLFSDIRSFSTLTELMTSEETFDFLNSYMLRMEPCITRHKGYIDKFIGDAIMAVFRSPDDAVAAARDMEDAVIEYNRKRIHDGRNPLSTGIGINTGPVMIGLLGTMVHMDSTVIGDAVNLSSRLESLTKLYGVRILISEFTYTRLKDRTYIRLIDRVRVKGRETPAGVYEVYGYGRPEVIAQKQASQPLFEQAYQLYLNRRFKEAAECFQECSDTCMRDLVSRVYLARCAYLQEHPPAMEWDGIFQKRAARFQLGDLPAKLYFEHSLHKKAYIPVIIHNISRSGIMISIDLEIELYIGERILIDFEVDIGNEKHSQIMTCQVMRGKPGRLANGDACLEYGLEYYEMTWQQKHAMEKIISVLEQKHD